MALRRALQGAGAVLWRGEEGDGSQAWEVGSVVEGARGDVRREVEKGGRAKGLGEYREVGQESTTTTITYN